MSDYFQQDEYEIRCEWGPEGARRFAPGSEAMIIIDVFSFTTCVDIAVSRGARVYPYSWKDERAEEYARSVGAILANASRKDPEGFSLAPSAMLRLQPGTALVLSSPNGATLSLTTGSTPTFAACLRNATAVAAAAANLGRRISVIPAGERWPDFSLRPALEDLLGAGAILNALSRILHGPCSPEAEAAIAVFRHFRDRLPQVLAACSSGKEAGDRGRPEDVMLASELDVSSAAPRLINGAYQAE